MPVQRRVPLRSPRPPRRHRRVPRAHRLQGGVEDPLHRRHQGRAVLAGGQPPAGRLRGCPEREIRLGQTRLVSLFITSKAAVTKSAGASLRTYAYKRAIRRAAAFEDSSILIYAWNADARCLRDRGLKPLTTG